MCACVCTQAREQERKCSENDRDMSKNTQSLMGIQPAGQGQFKHQKK